MSAQLPALLVVVPLLAALLAPLVAWRRPRWAWPLAAAVAGLTAALAGAALARALAGGPLRQGLGGWPAPWGIELVLDPLAGFVATVVAGVSACSLLYGAGLRDPRARDRRGVAATLALLLLAGLMGIVVAGDLFNLFVFLEVSALASYALVGAGGGRALIAAFRYLILGSLGASLYLLGVGHLYLLTGTLNMADLARLLPGLDAPRAVPLAIGLIVVGLGIKIGVAPLHGWLPDAYTHAPPAVAALLAPVATKVAAYALARVCFWVLGPWAAAGGALAGSLAWLGAASVLAGGLLALRQSDLRRLLAYSSVSQLGYVVLGLGLASGTALAGAFLHVLAHALMKGALFLIAGIGVARLGGPRLADLARLPRRAPVAAGCLVVAAFSMIGVPPTAGFSSKWYLLLGAARDGQWALAAVVVAGSLLAAAYMFRVLERALLEAPPAGEAAGAAPAGPAAERRPTVPAILLAPLLLLTAATLAAGLLNVAIVESVLRPALPPGLGPAP
jgi:multicomponent Na+:H+ antiporter subunit D